MTTISACLLLYLSQMQRFIRTRDLTLSPRGEKVVMILRHDEV
jgi:hypothetical protein